MTSARAILVPPESPGTYHCEQHRTVEYQEFPTRCRAARNLSWTGLSERLWGVKAGNLARHAARRLERLAATPPDRGNSSSIPTSCNAAMRRQRLPRKAGLVGSAAQFPTRNNESIASETAYPSRTPSKLKLKRAKYLRKRSASLLDALRARLAWNRLRPASLKLRAARQTLMTSLSCTRSNRSS